ncbi:uncharacterized protein LOC119280261 [Triticum dicoccoides]|uniref:uncharacterized protein LOC119280261 n=1 Tax=Triticum dicoccoides TaxID=85692 RepID=UPI0018908ABB|nr:uncharacterized protein LOC119280261 [Triticum dicoccoides]
MPSAIRQEDLDDLAEGGFIPHESARLPGNEIEPQPLEVPPHVVDLPDDNDEAPLRLRRNRKAPAGKTTQTASVPETLAHEGGRIPNTLNVISNIPFLFVGLAGLILCHYKNYFRLCSQGELWSWTLFYAGVTAVGVGSSYYHLYPNDATLVWDRLPMTIAFTSIVAIFIIERVDDRAGTKSLAPLVIAGALSILYWSFFDDLRPYAIIQFVPCIVIPVMAIVIPPMYTHSSYWLWAAGFYLLAKVEEAADKPIYRWTHDIVSGHTLKHLCAAMVPVFLTLMLAKRTIEPDRVSLLQMWKISWRERGSKDSNTVDVKYGYAAVSTTSEQQ